MWSFQITQKYIICNESIEIFCIQNTCFVCCRQWIAVIRHRMTCLVIKKLKVNKTNTCFKVWVNIARIWNNTYLELPFYSFIQICFTTFVCMSLYFLQSVCYTFIDFDANKLRVTKGCHFSPNCRLWAQNNAANCYATGGVRACKYCCLHPHCNDEQLGSRFEYYVHVITCQGHIDRALTSLFCDGVFVLSLRVVTPCLFASSCLPCYNYFVTRLLFKGFVFYMLRWFVFFL